MIYLDNNATTPVDPEVYDAILSSLKRDTGNPSSSHHYGAKAREAVEAGRIEVADLLGCGPDEVIFTSGGTESNNLAIMGTALRRGGRGHIITSAIEHPSVANVCRRLEVMGSDVTYVGVDRDGIVRMDAIEDAIRDDTFLISVMHSNNETGVIQPSEEIGVLARARGILYHLDAAQSVGKMPFSPVEMHADLVTVVSHKFYGPKGIGALYVRKGAAPEPILYGAAHEGGMRPGTENVAGIVGFGKACWLANRDMKLRASHAVAMRDLLFTSLKAAVPGLRLSGHESKRLPNTANVIIPFVPASALMEKIKETVAVSAGSACHAGVEKPSQVLKEMGLSDEEALCSVRLSVGKDTTEEEIRTAAGIIAKAALELRNAGPASGL